MRLVLLGVLVVGCVLLTVQLVQVGWINSAVGSTYHSSSNIFLIDVPMYLNLSLGMVRSLSLPEIGSVFPQLVALDCLDLFWKYGMKCLAAFQNPTQQLHIFRTFATNYIYTLKATPAMVPDTSCGNYSMLCPLAPMLQNDFCYTLFNTTFSVPVLTSSKTVFCSASLDQTVLFKKQVLCNLIPVSTYCGRFICFGIGVPLRISNDGDTVSFYSTDIGVGVSFCSGICNFVSNNLYISCSTVCSVPNNSLPVKMNTTIIIGQNGLSAKLAPISASMHALVSFAYTPTSCPLKSVVSSPLFLCIWTRTLGGGSTDIISINLTDNGGRFMEPGGSGISRVDGNYSATLVLKNLTNLKVNITVQFAAAQRMLKFVVYYIGSTTVYFNISIFDAQPSSAILWALKPGCGNITVSTPTPVAIPATPLSVFIGFGLRPCTNNNNNFSGYTFVELTQDILVFYSEVCNIDKWNAVPQVIPTFCKILFPNLGATMDFWIHPMDPDDTNWNNIEVLQNNSVSILFGNEDPTSVSFSYIPNFNWTLILESNSPTLCTVPAGTLGDLTGAWMYSFIGNRCPTNAICSDVASITNTTFPDRYIAATAILIPNNWVDNTCTYLNSYLNNLVYTDTSDTDMFQSWSNPSVQYMESWYCWPVPQIFIKLPKFGESVSISSIMYFYTGLLTADPGGGYSGYASVFTITFTRAIDNVRMSFSNGASVPIRTDDSFTGQLQCGLLAGGVHYCYLMPNTPECSTCLVDIWGSTAEYTNYQEDVPLTTTSNIAVTATLGTCKLGIPYFVAIDYSTFENPAITRVPLSTYTNMYMIKPMYPISFGFCCPTPIYTTGCVEQVFDITNTAIRTPSYSSNCVVGSAGCNTAY